jgi:hypothetical protein
VALASGGSLGVNGLGASSGSTLPLTVTATLAVGEVGVVCVASDNINTTDATHSEITSVTDSGGNTWQKAHSYTNGQGTAATGCTVEVWFTKATAQLTVSVGVITVNFASSIAERGISGWRFTATSGMGIAVNATKNQRADDATVGFGSLALAGLPSKQYIFLRACAMEFNNTSGLGQSAGYSLLTLNRSRNNAAAVLFRGEFIITTATGSTSNPTFAVTASDSCSVLVALEETASAALECTTLTSTVTTTGTLTTAILPVGALTATAVTNAAVLTTAIRMTGAAAVSVATTGFLPNDTSLAAGVTVAATTAASLSTGIPLAGALSGAIVLSTPPLLDSILLAGALTGAATTAGTLKQGYGVDRYGYFKYGGGRILGPAAELAGALAVQATTAATVTTGISLAGARTVSAVTNAAVLTTGIQLAAAPAVSVVTNSPVLSTQIRLVATPAVSVAAAATTLQTQILMAAALTARVTVRGLLEWPAAEIEVTTQAIASLYTEILLSADCTTSLVAAAAIDTEILLAGSPVADTNAEGDLSSAVRLAASILPTGVLYGDLTTRIRLVGSPTVSVTLSGSIYPPGHVSTVGGLSGPRSSATVRSTEPIRSISSPVPRSLE